MRQYQLRTYYFKSEAAAIDYLPRWRPHVGSLGLFGVDTHGFFSVPGEPKRVVALVSYEEGADADLIVHDYMLSDGFREDMAGFDLSQIERVETLALAPGEGSPLA